MCTRTPLSSQLFSSDASVNADAERGALLGTAHATGALLNDFAAGHEVTQALGLEGSQAQPTTEPLMEPMAGFLPSLEDGNVLPPGAAAAAAAAAAALEPLDPLEVRVVQLGALEPCEQSSEAAGFVDNIRSAGPYLHMHAGQTMVRKIAFSFSKRSYFWNVIIIIF